MSRTVLVVDDEPAVLSMMRRALSGLGYQVVEAKTGEQAIAQLEGGEPDAVVLDLVLPGIDGWEILHRLRSSGRLKDTPIIVMSAYTGYAAWMKAEKLGCKAFLQKPFSMHYLIRVLDGVLGATASSPKDA